MAPGRRGEGNRPTGIDPPRAKIPARRHYQQSDNHREAEEEDRQLGEQPDAHDEAKQQPEPWRLALEEPDKHIRSLAPPPLVEHVIGEKRASCRVDWRHSRGDRR